MTEHSPIQNAVDRCRYLLQRYQDDRCSEIAAALVYMSLFALVPLLTLVYSISTAIPTATDIQAQLQQFLVDNLLPEASQDVANYLTSFSEQAKNLTGVGIAILATTAVLMLRNVERAFNNIWRNRENRNVVSSVLLYWAVLSLAPILIGLGIGIKAYLFAAAHAVEGIDVLGVSSALLSLLPFVLGILGVTALYMAVPNCAVPFRHAIFGGLFVAVTFTAAKALFTAAIANSSYALIYGAFAAVPIFLLWLYITWTIILLGAIVVHSQASYQTAAQAQRPVVLKALDVLYLLWRAQLKGYTLGELKILSDRDVIGDGLDSDSWRHIRDSLMAANLITQTLQGHYILSRDLHHVRLIEIKALINQELEVPVTLAVCKPWQIRANALLSEQRQVQSEVLSISLQELFSTAEGDSALSETL
ncbi:YihY family inner membrane protein [Luminiphilus sp. nBUS_07]|uniref:YihY family inner membrane protein n=1 Tax=Luminiphilus sp. nBUS_07 TaxID=3395314 RepID=UPI003EB7EE41